MIKKIICLIVSSFYFITVFSETNQVSQIISRLNQIEHYRGEALFRVTLPMTDEEVEYRLSLRCQRNPTDTSSITTPETITISVIKDYGNIMRKKIQLPSMTK